MKNTVMMIEYIEQYSENAKFPFVALFDSRDLTEEQAREALKLDGIIKNPQLVTMTKEQYDNVFRSLLPHNNNTEFIFTVKRTRQSVTQGTATVYLNGAEITTFGDTIELIKDGQQYYGAKYSNWASVKPDGDFIHGVLFHPHENLYHLSDKVRKILKNDRVTGEAMPGRRYIDIDKMIAAAKTQEEIEAWESKRADLEKYGIDFCEGWHVGIYKHICGHWEILQSPIYINHDGTPAIINGKPYTAEDADKELLLVSAKSKCTRCTCGY